MRSEKLYRKLNGKTFRSRRVRFTAEQVAAFNKLFDQGGCDGEGNKNDEVANGQRNGSGKTLPHV
jgi:hypothetical protein